MSVDISIIPSGNIFVASFFTSNTDLSAKIAVSLDGKSFAKINSRKLRSDGVAIDLRDASIFYHNGFWLMAGTSYAAGVRDFRIFKSRDLSNWTQFDVTLGTSAVCGTIAPGGAVTCDHVWAPEWVLLDNQLYVLISLQVQADFTDIDGRTLKFFRPYYSALTDFDSMSFSAPQALSISDSGCKIDASIVKLTDGTLRLAIQDQNDKKIEIYSSNSLSGSFTFVSEAGFDRVEGPSVTKAPTGAYRIYADDWNRGQTLYVDTSDFLTFSAPSQIYIDGDSRHATFHSLNDFNNPVVAAGSLSRFAALGGSPIVDGAFKQAAYAASYDAGTRLASGSVTLSPYQNFCYFVSGSDVSEVTIANSDTDRFFLSVQSQGNAAGIRVLDGDYFEASTGVAEWIGFGQDKETIVEFSRSSLTGKFRMMGKQSTHLGRFTWANRPDATQYAGYTITITDQAVGYWTAISNGARWIPQNGNTVLLARGRSDISLSDATTSKQTFATYTIPAGMLGPNGKIMVTAKLQLSASDADAKAFTVELGGTTLFTQSMANGKSMLMDAFSIENRESVSSQLGSLASYPGGGVSSSVNFATSSVNTAVNQDLTLSFKYDVSGTGTKTAVLKSYSIEMIG